MAGRLCPTRLFRFPLVSEAYEFLRLLNFRAYFYYGLLFSDRFASIGSYSCIGRVLALMELRSVLSRIALNFDLAFAPGEDGEVFDKDVIDKFVLGVRDLQVVFTKREEMRPHA